MSHTARKKSNAERKAKQRSVLFISALDVWSLGNGKGGPALYNTLIGYASRGWKVYFITGNRGDISGHDLHENINIIRFDAPWLKKLMKIKKIGFFAKAIAKAIWWFYFQIVSFVIAIYMGRKHQFDVVYGYEIYGTPVAKLLSKIWGVPMVSRFQGTIFGVRWDNKIFRNLIAWEHFLGLRVPADLIIMTNDGTQGDKVLLELGIDMHRVRFWMNGVSWDYFRILPAQAEAKESLGIGAKNVLLTLSRLVSWKRVERSIRALPNIICDFPNTLLFIVGDGPERESLKKLAQDLGVADHVCFAGAIPYNEIAKYFVAADIFLSFYDCSNVGNPLLEAMMAGKCIVTLNNGDTGQFVKNGENGILLEHEDLPRLPEVIKGLLADEERRRYLGANARKFAEENFWTWEERIRAEIAEVEKLVARRAGK